MKRFEAIIDDEGRVGLPQELLEDLGVRPGTRVGLRILDGELYVHWLGKTLDEIAGSIKPLHPMSEDFDDEIEEAMSEWYAEEYPESVRR